MRIQFYNLLLDDVDINEGLQCVRGFFDSSQNNFIAFVNAHCFNVSQKDTEYRKALLGANLILNDGIGVKIGMRLKKQSLKENMNGTDFIPRVLELSSIEKKNVFFLGGKPGVSDIAVKNVQSQFPDLNIVGSNDGYFIDSDEVIKKINSLKTDVLIVGMGVPRQELWIAENKNKLNTKVCIAGGAIIDFQAGNVKRAPVWIQKLHLEWVYRLVQEPRRLWKRYFIGNAMFFLNLYKLRKFINEPAT